MFNWFNKKEKQFLPYTTDIHCHILPGIDDGSPDIDHSLPLLQHMVEWGLKRIVPTPHVTEDVFENTPETIDPPYNQLLEAAREAGIGLELLAPAAEYRIDPFFVDQLAAGHVRTHPGNHILVENGFLTEPWNIDNLLYELMINGYHPILAHPERYAYYYANKDRYRELHDRGIKFQCNLLSFAGYYGKAPGAVAKYLMENDMVDFLGTDLHNARHVEAINKWMETRSYRLVADTLRDRILNDTL